MMSNVLVKRQQERDLKQHHERIQHMKPCVDSKLGRDVRDRSPSLRDRSPSLPTAKRLSRIRVDKDKLRQIEQQNYRLLMRLRHIHKHYSLYMPRKSVYLQRGEAGRAKEHAKKPEKPEETATCSVAPMYPDNHSVNGEMANQLAGMKLRA